MRACGGECSVRLRMRGVSNALLHTCMYICRYEADSRLSPSYSFPISTNTTTITMSRRPTTFRITNIPSDTTLSALRNALQSCMLADERAAITVEATLSPSATVEEDDTATALATFSPRTPSFLDPLAKGADDVQIETDLGDLSLDKMFYGLTQLYPTTPGARIVAE